MKKKFLALALAAVMLLAGCGQQGEGQPVSDETWQALEESMDNCADTALEFLTKNKSGEIEGFMDVLRGLYYSGQCNSLLEKTDRGEYTQEEALKAVEKCRKVEEKLRKLLDVSA